MELPLRSTLGVGSRLQFTIASEASSQVTLFVRDPSGTLVKVGRIFAPDSTLESGTTGSPNGYTIFEEGRYEFFATTDPFGFCDVENCELFIVEAVPVKGASNDAPNGRFRALVIGVSDYSGGFTTLQGSERDARRLAYTMAARGYETTTRIGAVSQAELEETIQKFVGNAGRKDTLIFYFAGHGSQAQGNQFLLVPSDASTDGNTIRGGILLRDVVAMARRTSAQSALFITDACFAGEDLSTPMPPRHASGSGIPGLAALAFSKQSFSRLPSEEEWGYAARVSQYAETDDVDGVAWNGGNYKFAKRPVAPTKADSLGLSDMSGNAWEWVWDSFRNDYEGAHPGGSALESHSRPFRLFQGGSWNTNVEAATAVYRYRRDTGFNSKLVGLRLARSFDTRENPLHKPIADLTAGPTTMPDSSASPTTVATVLPNPIRWAGVTSGDRSFHMGSLVGENSQAIGRSVLPQAFWMSHTEVSQSEWEEYTTRSHGDPLSSLTELNNGALTRIVLLSTSPGQLSYESPEQEHGVFTQALLDALSGNADSNGDGFVSVHELADYVKRRTITVTDGRQQPMIFGNMGARELEFTLLK